MKVQTKYLTDVLLNYTTGNEAGTSFVIYLYTLEIVSNHDGLVRSVLGLEW